MLVFARKAVIGRLIYSTIPRMLLLTCCIRNSPLCSFSYDVEFMEHSPHFCRKCIQLQSRLSLLIVNVPCNLKYRYYLSSVWKIGLYTMCAFLNLLLPLLWARNFMKYIHTWQFSWKVFFVLTIIGDALPTMYRAVGWVLCLISDILVWLNFTITVLGIVYVLL